MDKQKFVNDRVITVLKNHVRFALLKVESCNGMCNISFSNAVIDFTCMNVQTSEKTAYCTLEQIFSRGISLLEYVKNIGDMHDLEKSALTSLAKYVNLKEEIEKALKEVFKKEHSETDITVALSKHLLKELAPGSCILDNTMQRKQCCLCNCMNGRDSSNYGNTGIGHISVWHGPIDIIFTPPELPQEDMEDMTELFALLGISTEKKDTASGRTTEKPKMTKAESKKTRQTPSDPNRNAGASPAGKSIAEVKKMYTDAALNQAIAQAIVFSCIQKKDHPEFPQNHIVPNILISPELFRIIIYDAQNDVLLCSQSIKLFNSEGKLSKRAILVLWMVLHHTAFWSVLDDEFNKYKSNFPACVGDKWNSYLKEVTYLDTGYYKPYPNLDELLSNGEKI